MKKIVKNKLLIIILIFFCIIAIPMKQVVAKSISDIFTKADDFVSKGQQSGSKTTISESAIKEMSDTIYNTLIIIAIVLAIIIGLVLAIKFMIGSIEEQAKVKQTLIAYIVGCVVAFGAFTIWKIVVTILQST